MDQTHDRRQFLRVAAGAAAGTVLLTVVPARAMPAATVEAIRQVVGSAQVQPGKVSLTVPPLSENGNSVPLEIRVDSPMTEAAHVKSIHVFTEKNPQPNVVDIHLGPRAGRATVATRIRLADSQTVTAIAALSDGTFWSASASVVVTIAACAEEL
jgi:sulfur-oxidizing protein SoxY